jgi:hypothetical protein
MLQRNIVLLLSVHPLYNLLVADIRATYYINNTVDYVLNIDHYSIFHN